MGYQFKGFFAKAEESLIEEAERKWFGCRGRIITTPFRGIGLSSPDWNCQESDEAYEQAIEISYALEDQLPE